MVSHIEEVVLATSGEDTFELVFALAASRVLAKRGRDGKANARTSLRSVIEKVAEAHPELDVSVPRDATDALLAQVDGLLARALPTGERRGEALGALDAVFESLVPRIAKGDKGQFFTPRHVVDFVVRALEPRAGELVVDPACGSGAFLAHARARARVSTFGSDIDPRAVRVARLSALAQGRSAESVVRADGLRSGSMRSGKADVVATNPPFAGRADADGFAVAEVVRTPERDVLFLERSLDLLRPGGRLGIVLPYNKAAGASFGGLRRWLAERARLFAVVGLPRETFLPHTAQRTFVLFAKKRRKGERADPSERTMFVVSEKAGKDSAGDPIVRGAGGALDHDLEGVISHLAPFLSAEGFSS
ncbi:Type I restriction-modification system, DNA-methyltransferase subunit M [Labilithrix luteola]|uniref:Type I restriction-modification system, DNA-methyltransferase subunit M n=1 Tax=Labilithrix luteola TaxID=1391654 RepID=A0A0K1QDH9_9BACT|nr:Type I restriction-modification system, DNA-methyltransferase subunit M [Labilithrix luteola]